MGALDARRGERRYNYMLYCEGAADDSIGNHGSQLFRCKIVMRPRRKSIVRG
jgi:hypothetical protein